MKNILEEVNKRLAKSNGETIRIHTDKLLERAKIIYELGYISEDEYKLLASACEYHDYGKVNELFQNRVFQKMEYGKVIRFDKKNELPHNVLSACFVPDTFEDKMDYYRVLLAVLHHHPSRGDGTKINDIVSTESERISEELKEYDDIKILSKGTCSKMAKLVDKNDIKTIMIKGLLHKCDYSASADISIEYKNDFLEQKLEGLSYKWNDLQNFCKEHQQDNLIITAPTGMGKTEAGLLWIGNTKGFFVLPLRTAINAMYDRISSQILHKEKVKERLALLHSDMKEYYLKNEDDINAEKYYEVSKQMSLPLTVSTMDQIFDFVFKYDGYEYKLAQLAYSKIVIDEIQMYDPALLAFLVYGIKRIHDIGGKVAVLTATFPPFVKDKLAEALNGEYVEENYALDGKDRHFVKIIQDKMSSSYIHSQYSDLTGKSKKVLVICNSVKKAQIMYDELSKFGDVPVYLLHSRFIKKDRALKESEILQCGKTFSDDGSQNLDVGNVIWISTSLVEASLDIDFDYIFTELNDLFSLFQRFGRCNRKGMKKDFGKYNCYVFTELDDIMRKYLVTSEMYIYSKQALIDGVDGLLSEEKKDRLIKEYLSYEKLCDSQYAAQYNEIYEYIENMVPYEGADIPKLRNINMIDIIPESVYEENKEEIQKYEIDINEPHKTPKEKIEALSRLKEYCVSIKMYIKKQSATKHSITIGGRNMLDVIDGYYSSEKGFEPKIEKKQTSIKQKGDFF